MSAFQAFAQFVSDDDEEKKPVKAPTQKKKGKKVAKNIASTALNNELQSLAFGSSGGKKKKKKGKSKEVAKAVMTEPVESVAVQEDVSAGAPNKKDKKTKAKPMSLKQFLAPVGSEMDDETESNLGVAVSGATPGQAPAVGPPPGLNVATSAVLVQSENPAFWNSHSPEALFELVAARDAQIMSLQSDVERLQAEKRLLYDRFQAIGGLDKASLEAQVQHLQTVNTEYVAETAQLRQMIARLQVAYEEARQQLLVQPAPKRC